MSEPKSINSVAKMLFFGEVANESDIFPFPGFTAEQKEMSREMIDAVSRFCEEQIDSEKLDETSQISDEIIQGLAELGLLGLAVEEDYGGMNLDYTLYSRVFAEVAKFDGAVATTIGAHQSIGYRALINEGNAEQKAHWLPKLTSGECLAAFALTEPGSGSDAYSIKTKAVDNGDGTYTLNGQKLWITNAGRAQFYSVYCKTDHEIDGKTVEKISCFIVDKDMEGVSFGAAEKKMGIKASETRAVFFDNVKVPKENLLGELGQGFKIAMNVLNSGRLSLGSGSVGGMRYALKLATEHAKGRKQFDKPIAEWHIISEKLAKMAANIYATESTVYFTTGLMDRGMKDYSLESAICKVFCSEKLWETVDISLQIAGGNGYMKEYPYERMMRDSRINLIFEGTNEILRVFIALAGVRDPSEGLKELGKMASDVSGALADPIKSLGVLSGFAKKRIEKLMGSKSLTKCHPALEETANNWSLMLSDFSIKVENTLMKYGKKIIDFELPQKRIANMCIDLYVMLAVMSRTSFILDNSEISQEDKDYVANLTHIICTDMRHNFIENFKAMDKNYDKQILEVCKGVCERDGYGLEITEF